MEESLLKILLGGAVKSIPSSSDLNSYGEIGIYRAISNTIASTISNCPTGKAFVMKVEIGWRDDLTTQTILDYTNDMYTRTRSTTGWNEWKRITAETV